MEWISVEDKLPEIGRRIIGATPIDEDCWSMETGKFCNPENFNGLAVLGSQPRGWWQWISHWMPLPEPPKEE